MKMMITNSQHHQIRQYGQNIIAEGDKTNINLPHTVSFLHF